MRFGARRIGGDGARWTAGLRTALTAVCLLALSLAGGSAQQAPVARAVLFYSPTCPHCHRVMEVDLPQLERRHGARLEVATIDVSTLAGAGVYQAVIDELRIPRHRLGVPTLVAGRTVLVGSGEIPSRFPGLVDEALAGDGMDWPDVPAVRAWLYNHGMLAPPAEPAPDADADTAAAAPVRARAATGTAATSPARDASARPPAAAVPAAHAPAAVQAVRGAQAAAPSAVEPPDAPAMPGAGVPAARVELLDEASPARELPAGRPTGGSVQERFRGDPLANTLALIVLFGMVGALLSVAAAWRRRAQWRSPPWWALPALALVGTGVAGYLAYIEVTGTLGVCGPVGNCNVVQQSVYARIFGVLPIGVLGIAGYLLILDAWVIERLGPPRLRPAVAMLLFVAALAGTLFSIYLTFLEPFVIGATCAWCLSSAIIMTLLLLTTAPAILAQRRTRAPTENALPGAGLPTMSA
jgi:uncharacterized membrane protein